MIRRTRLEGSSLLRWTLAFSALASIAACGSEAPGWVSGDSGDSQATSAPEFSVRSGLRSSKEMPAELRAAYIRSVQRDAPETYAAGRIQANEFRVKNASQSFDAKLDPNGIELLPRDASWSFSLRTTGIGCDNEVVSLAEPTMEAEGNRIRYVRAGVEEWYLNGPLGMEQGFVLEQAPACAGPKVIQMRTGGDLRPELDDADGDGEGESIRFMRTDGGAPLTMSHLYVSDAQGKVVPAWMTVEFGNVSIHVDDEGATYPLDIDPLIAVLEAKIPTPGNTASGQFGYGLSFQGNIALVGAPKTHEFGNESGSAYVFERQSPGVWVQQGPKLLPSDGRPQQWFGFSVALSGDTAIITAPFDTDGGAASGSAYVFTRAGNVWSQQAKLKPADNKVGDVFGISGAISGDRIVVGAHGCDSVTNGNESGAVYSFTRTAGIWTQEQKLIASDGEPGELFGTTVTISPEAIGAASVYDDDQGFHSGSMYMFASNGVSWVEQQKLLAPAGKQGDLFGYWAAISGDTMIVSAALYDDGVANSDFGAAFVYVKGATTWNLQQKLIAPDRKAGDWFGSHVAIEGNSILVGAQQTDEFGVDSGSAYWWIRTSSVWNLRDKLLPVPGTASERFGWTVGVSGNLAAVGAPFDDTKATDAGAVYIFIEKKTNGEPCAVDTECVSDFCIDGVCCDTVCGDGSTGDCQACSKATGAPVDGTCSAIAAGVSCRNSAGACDAPEVCNGVEFQCPADGKIAVGTQCRAALDLCDVAETCDGVTNNCPADGAAPAGTECRASIGGCDVAEKCTGFAPVCPPDTKVAGGTTCRASTGACDSAELCDGISGVCPGDGKFPAGVECRGSLGACDAPEVCDGTTNTCPNDQKIASGTQCRASAGACDGPEVCNGIANDCPVDTKLTMGTLCRASMGICDQPETCDGVTNSCPTDTKSPPGILCRASADLCDQPETCDGLNDVCPNDSKLPVGTQCRASAGLCDVSETCDGLNNACPTDGKLAAGQVCRLPKGLCDEFEFCNGVGNDCPVDQKTPAGVFCRGPKGLCDEPEACNGSADACPPDQLTPTGTLCRGADGICDITEVCTGKSAQCPADKLVTAGVECRASQGTCDVSESCDGQTVDCPEDSRVEEGIACRASGGECDALEACDGKGVNCPKDLPADNGTICSAGVCEEGVCTEVPPPIPEDYALYGGGPVCQTNPGGAASSSWSLAFLALALGSLRRRFRSSKH